MPSRTASSATTPDAGDVIVHLFRPEVRSFYNLERMWAFGDGPVAVPRATGFA